MIVGSVQPRRWASWASREHQLNHLAIPRSEPHLSAGPDTAAPAAGLDFAELTAHRNADSDGRARLSKPGIG